MFRARLRARLCRGKEGLHRAPTFVRQFGGYTHHLLLFLSSTHNCPLFHTLVSEIYPLLTTLRPSKGGLKRQSLLQRPGVGLRPAADHPQMVTTPGVWILRTRAQDPCRCCCRPGVGLRPAADHPQMVTTPGVLDPADPRARLLQLLLQTWCGSAPRRGPSAYGNDAWRLGSCGPGRKIPAAAAADLVWVCAPPRTIRKW